MIKPFEIKKRNSEELRLILYGNLVLKSKLFSKQIRENSHRH